MDKVQKPKKKVKQNLTQKEKFIEYAKENNLGEDWKLFEKTVGEIVKNGHKKAPD